MMNNKVLLGLACLFLGGILFVAVQESGITGRMVYTTPDYESFKHLLTDEAFELLSTSSPFSKERYIILLENYTSSVEEVRKHIGTDDKTELPLTQAVIVDSQKKQLVDILSHAAVRAVHADEVFEVLRTDAFDLINLTTIRESGPVKYNMTGAGVAIAILDTGINLSNPEFNCTSIGGSCPVKKGFSVISSSADFIDTHGHGTNVAGIIHAAAPNANLHIYKVTEGSTSTLSTLLKGFEQAIADEADIISISLGSSRGSDGQGVCDHALLSNLLSVAESNDALVVAATGNEPNHKVYLPACLPGAIAISAIDADGNPASYSTTGEEVDFSMIGTYTNVSVGNGATGTSFAAPLASAVFALLQEAAVENYGLKLLPHQLYQIAKANATDIHTPGFDEQTGHGMLALEPLMHGLLEETTLFAQSKNVTITKVAPTTTLSLFSTKPTSATITWENYDSGSENETLSLMIDGTTASPHGRTISATPLSLPIAAVPGNALPSGAYTINITITHEHSDQELIIPVTYLHVEIPEDYAHVFGLFSQMQYEHFFWHLLLGGFDDEGFEEYLENLNISDDIDLDDVTVIADLVLAFVAENSAEVPDYILELIDFFTASMQNDYEHKRKFNKNNKLIPILRTESLLDTYYMEISNADGTTSLDGMYSNGTVVFVEGLDKNTNAFDGFYAMTSPGIYFIDVIAEIAGVNMTVESTHFTVDQDLSITVKEGFFFIDKPDVEIAFEVYDHVGVPLLSIIPQSILESLGIDVDRVISYTDGNYGPATIEAKVHNTPLDLTYVAVNDYVERIVTTLPSSTFSEGTQQLEITYTAAENTGSISTPVFLTHPITITPTVSNNLLSEFSDVTLFLNTTKSGAVPASVSGNIHIEEACMDAVLIQNATFTHSGIHSNNSATHTALLQMQDQIPMTKTCEIIIGTTVIVNGIPYTANTSKNITVEGENTPPSITFAPMKSQLFRGERVPFNITITNDVSAPFNGMVQLLAGDDTNATIIYAQSVSIPAFDTASVVAPSVAIPQAASTTFTARVFNQNVNASIQETYHPRNDYLVPSVERDLLRVYQNDSVALTVKALNNNKQSNVTFEITEMHGLQFTSNGGQVRTIGPGSTGFAVFNITAVESGVVWAAGRVSAEDASFNWNHSFLVSPGKLIRIDLDSTPRRYDLTMEDVVYFVVDNNCEEVNKTCSDTCRADRDVCTDSCRADFDLERDAYTFCRDSCSQDNAADRQRCRDRCQDDYNIARLDHDDCRDMCSDDFDTCSLSCTDDFRDCTDDAVEVFMYVDPDYDPEFSRLELLFEADYEQYVRLSIGESKLLDLDDDGYYETEITLNNMFEKDSVNICHDECRVIRDTQKDVCRNEHDVCRINCDDAFCRDNCRDTRTFCLEQADDDYDFCTDDCRVVYGSYRITLGTIEKVAIPGRHIPLNLSGNNTTIVNDTIDLNQSINDTTPPQNETTPVPGDPSDAECSSQNLEACVDAFSCVNVRGYWYNNACHATREQPVDQPPSEQNETQDPEPVPQPPPIEQPIPVQPSSSNLPAILILITLIVLAGGGGVAFLKIRHSAASSSTQEDTHTGTSSLHGNSNEKAAKLSDYIMKQLCKGYNLPQIVGALKKLGWETDMVDTVAQQLAADATKREIVDIVRFASTYGITDPALLQQKFPQTNPNTIGDAMHQINRLRQ